MQQAELLNALLQAFSHASELAVAIFSSQAAAMDKSGHCFYSSACTLQ
jgi:hypothetical protein